ncbi:MAG: response regulator transcription factor [Bacteroidota bacterium]|nr:response regulator transcription factor [Bacteroidota bacterium]
MEKKTTILVADDHPLFRAGVVNFLKERNYIVAGEANDGEETIELVKNLSPDILILDMDMPKYNGLQVIERVSEISPETKIIFMTMYKEEKLFKGISRNSAQEIENKIENKKMGV